MPHAGWPAPAKINLFLRVLERMSDGYHRIQTVFQLLDWGDTLHIETTDNGAIRRTNDVPGIAEPDDLCIRAATLLRNESGCPGGAVIGVDKQIPTGAGLGGGSSDAATVLCALNFHWELGLSLDDLCELGRRLGADVPVFIRGQSAWAEGVGDQLLPMVLGERHYLLLFPGIEVSTASVFNDPDLPRENTPLKQGELALENIGNDCEGVVLARHPELAQLFGQLREWGQPRLTGTGSSIFVEMESKEAAKRAANMLNCRYNARAVRGLDHSPMLKRLGEAAEAR